MPRLLVLLALLGVALAQSSCEVGTPCASAAQYCDLSGGSPGVCVDRTLCEPGTYAEAVAPAFDEDTICTDCDGDCLTCFGPSDEECTSCDSGFFLQDVTLEAESVGGVPPPLLFGHCEDCTVCPAGTFEKHPCTPISDSVCVDCPDSCPAGTRNPCAAPGTGTADACVPCGPACSVCSDKGCSACFEGHVLQEGKCVACSTLLPNCGLCTLVGSIPTCTVCHENYGVVAGVCKSLIRSPPPPPKVGPTAVRSPPPPPVFSG